MFDNSSKIKGKLEVGINQILLSFHIACYAVINIIMTDRSIPGPQEHIPQNDSQYHQLSKIFDDYLTFIHPEPSVHSNCMLQGDAISLTSRPIKKQSMSVGGEDTTSDSPILQTAPVNSYPLLTQLDENINQKLAPYYIAESVLQQRKLMSTPTVEWRINDEKQILLILDYLHGIIQKVLSRDLDIKNFIILHRAGSYRSLKVVSAWCTDTKKSTTINFQASMQSSKNTVSFIFRVEYLRSTEFHYRTFQIQ